jgi:hypothetical protein
VLISKLDGQQIVEKSKLIWNRYIWGGGGCSLREGAKSIINNERKTQRREIYWNQCACVFVLGYTFIKHFFPTFEPFLANWALKFQKVPVNFNMGIKTRQNFMLISKLSRKM